MNKAFVREPDEVDPRCPKCGTPGEKVSQETLQAHLAAAALKQLGPAAYWCPTEICEVAYFDPLEQCALATQLLHPLYPKDPAAAICPCFGLTEDDVEQDIREGIPRRIRELLVKSKSAAAHCVTAAANGRCCVPEVQRYYFRRKAAWDAGK